VNPWPLLKGWLKAPMFSPAGFVVRAVALALLYLMLSLAGFRHYMSVLSLTFPEGSSRDWSLFAGMLYLISHFLWILGVPILLIAAGLMRGVAELRSRFLESPTWASRRAIRRPP
jgi:hypothetical protein